MGVFTTLSIPGYAAHPLKLLLLSRSQVVNRGWFPKRFKRRDAMVPSSSLEFLDGGNGNL